LPSAVDIQLLVTVRALGQLLYEILALSMRRPTQQPAYRWLRVDGQVLKRSETICHLRPLETHRKEPQCHSQYFHSFLHQRISQPLHRTGSLLDILPRKNVKLKFEQVHSLSAQTEMQIIVATDTLFFIDTMIPWALCSS